MPELSNSLKPKSLIVLRDLSKVYREGTETRSVLADVNAEIPEGKFSALVGPSGSGKSTLLNLISGIDVPTSGQVVIDGTDLTALSEKQRTLFRRKNIGMVFQFFNLLPTLTVLENLLLPLQLNGGSAATESPMELLQSVGLGDRSKSFPDQLSGGQQQRVAIARALVHDPRIVVADEPTGNLDAATGAQILELLSNLSADRGKTLLVVSHSAAVVQRADMVYRLLNGRVEVETPSLGQQPSPSATS